MKKCHFNRFATSFFPLIPLLAAQCAFALSITPVTSDNGYPALKVQWTDSAGLPRTAIMVNQNTTTPPYTGYLRRYTYEINGATRVCTGTENYADGGDLEFSGDGFVQNHTAGGGDFSSGNGAGVPGTTTVILQGTSHAIIQYDMPNYEIDGPYTAPVYQKVPTTVQWFFADGRSHPIFSISQDARQAGGNLAADSRSPYGDVAYDGDSVNAYVGGASYGDTYKFVTLAAEQVTTNSGWQDTQTNTIPYAMQWAEPATVDGEMGHVATLPILVYDQGLDSQVFNSDSLVSYYQDNRGLAQPNGPMIADQTWAYQIFAENPIWPGPNVPIQSKRLTWGANFGRVGGFDEYGQYTDINNYCQHSTDPVGNPPAGEYKTYGDRADGTLMAYSVFVVLGSHLGGYTNGTVGKQVAQMENVTRAAVTVSIGTVETSGPSGVGNATSRTITYTPAGFNPTYATWEIAAKTNAVNATLAPAASHPLDHPLFVINGYTGSQLPGNIAVGAGFTNAGVDYFATLDTNSQRLWITVNRSVTNALNLVVSASGGGGTVTSAPVITSAPASGAPGAVIVITGENFTGATAVTFNGVAATFTVDSATQITATVPEGATSGAISITTPGGMAQSASAFTVAAAPGNLAIYTDSLQNGFQNYSWATNVDFSNTVPVYSGSYSIEVTGAAYTALSLYHDDFDTSSYTNLSFWINGGAAGAQGIQVMGVVTQAYQAIYYLPALAPNTWTQFTIPLSELGVASVTNCQGFWFWPTLDGATTFYVDSIQLNGAVTSTVAPSLSASSSLEHAGSFVLQLSGTAGQTYWMQTSTDLVTWMTVSTNVAAAASVNITNSVIAGASKQFWRAMLAQ